MAASSAGALKAYIEGLGLNLPIFRDRAPDGQALPYGTVMEDLTTVPDPAGSVWDKDSPAAVMEHAQVDLWQQWRDLTATPPKVVEDYSLAPKLRRALHGCQLPTAPTRVWGVTVFNVIRLLEVDQNIVHHAITVVLQRDL